MASRKAAVKKPTASPPGHPHGRSTSPPQPVDDPPIRVPGERSTTRAGRARLPTCGAATRGRDRTPCRNPAGKGTDHPGEGRCKNHGGVGQKPTLRYQALNARPRLRELIERFSADPDPHNLLQELTLLRALVTDYVERYDETTEALLAWHASFGPGYQEAIKLWRGQLADWVEQQDSGEAGEPPPLPIPEAFVQKPRQMIDIVAAAGYIDKIGQLSERIEKRRKEGMVSLAVFDSVLERLGMELVHAIREVGINDTARTALLATVEWRWAAIQLDPAAGAVPGPETSGRGPLN
jgi:hypothetical protein